MNYVRLNKLSVLLIILFCLVLQNDIAAQQKQKKGARKSISVSDASQLQWALDNAKPGDNIELKDGIYIGNFRAVNSGNTENYIKLTGSRNAIIEGKSTETGYVLHLEASFWQLKGFTIRNGLKGLMIDGGQYNLIDSILVENIGEEGVHFRKFSHHNTLQQATIRNTGLKNPEYGEGVYIGSAVSNWGKYTNGKPDKCDSNKVINNFIGPNCTAESIDVKEGTTGGFISGNHFDATGITGANSGDSWMDVKGNGYIIEYNNGFNPAGSVLADGYQVHCAVDGWGCFNIFRLNKSTVNAKGYGFNISVKGSKGVAVGNKVYGNNEVFGAENGLTNIDVSE